MRNISKGIRKHGNRYLSWNATYKLTIAFSPVPFLRGLISFGDVEKVKYRDSDEMKEEKREMKRLKKCKKEEYWGDDRNVKENPTRW